MKSKTRPWLRVSVLLSKAQVQSSAGTCLGNDCVGGQITLIMHTTVGTMEQCLLVIGCGRYRVYSYKFCRLTPA